MEEVIEHFSNLRNLGVILYDDSKFDHHIEKVVSKVRLKLGWILRTFYRRNVAELKQLWKTLFQCHIDYCSQLYKPGQSKAMHCRMVYD